MAKFRIVKERRLTEKELAKLPEGYSSRSVFEATGDTIDEKNTGPINDYIQELQAQDGVCYGAELVK